MGAGSVHSDHSQRIFGRTTSTICDVVVFIRVHPAVGGDAPVDDVGYQPSPSKKQGKRGGFLYCLASDLLAISDPVTSSVLLRVVTALLHMQRILKRARHPPLHELNDE